MSYSKWIKKLDCARKTSVIVGNIRKIHYTFLDDGNDEMLEEYSLDTGCVLRRAWKTNKKISILAQATNQWEIELGENLPKNFNGNVTDNDNILIESSSTEPFIIKRITKKIIEWRIRNLPYPIDVYSVVVDTTTKKNNDNCIVISTKNQKYYKRLSIPELIRCELLPEQNQLSYVHQFNTLIITYKKPSIVNEMEKAVLILLQDIETENLLE